MILRDAHRDDYRYIKELYRSSFPLAERIPLPILRRMQQKGLVRVLLAIVDSQPLGVAVTACRNGVVLLNYLAVDPAARGCGIGSRMLSALMHFYRGCRLVLEIEAPDENRPDTIRRKNFYLRGGLEDSGIRVRLGGIKMELLTLAGAVSVEEYLDVYRYMAGDIPTRALVRIL